MERIMTAEERIRRAEEIYYKRRNQGGIRVSTNSMNISENRKISLGKKMGIQIMVCLIIYSIFWLIKDKDNVFSTNFINETRNILNYDINLPKIYNDVQEYFSQNFNNIIKTNGNANETNNVTNDETLNNQENDVNAGNENLENNNTTVNEQNNQTIEEEQPIENSLENTNELNPVSQTTQDIRDWWWKRRH